MNKQNNLKVIKKEEIFFFLNQASATFKEISTITKGIRRLEFFERNDIAEEVCEKISEITSFLSEIIHSCDFFGKTDYDWGKFLKINQAIENNKYYLVYQKAWNIVKNSAKLSQKIDNYIQDNFSDLYTF